MTRCSSLNSTPTRALVMFLLLLSVIASTAVRAAENSVMRFDRLTIDDGLAQSSVMAIAQDDAGFIWFATESGLDRYDGHSIVNLRQQRGNPNSLASDFVRDIRLAADGTFWVATDGGGISSLDTASETIQGDVARQALLTAVVGPHPRNRTGSGWRCLGCDTRCRFEPPRRRDR